MSWREAALVEPVLVVSGLCAGYAGREILHAVDLSVGRGELAAVLGSNGAGKSTLNRAISGVLRPSRGTIWFAGESIAGAEPGHIVECGLIHVPEGRRIFPNLTVRENLVATAANRLGAADPWTLAKVHALFPRLAERGRNMGGQLSGGEQQMLAIGRALMTNPRLLILDEATEGLAPLIRAEIWGCLGQLKRAGLAILLIDKNVDVLTRIADRHYFIERGRIVWSGSSPELARAPDVQHRYMGV